MSKTEGALVAPESCTPLRVDPLVRNRHSLGPRYLLTEFAAQELYYLGQRWIVVLETLEMVGEVGKKSRRRA